MNLSIETLVERGINLRVLGKLQEAMECFAQVMEVEEVVYNETGKASNSYVEALGQAAGICGQWGQYDTALHFSSSAVGFCPTYPGLWMIHGNGELGLGHLDEAEKAYDNAIGADRYHSPGWAMKSRVLLEKGDVPQAIRHARRAITLDRSNDFAHTTLGLAELRRGNIDLAEASLRSALEINPDDSFAQLAMKEFLGRDDQGIDTVGQGRVDTELAALVKQLARGPIVNNGMPLPKSEVQQADGAEPTSVVAATEPTDPMPSLSWWKKLLSWTRLPGSRK